MKQYYCYYQIRIVCDVSINYSNPVKINLLPTSRAPRLHSTLLLFEIIAFLPFIPLQKQKVLNSCPPEFCLVKRFWKYILGREVSYMFQAERSRIIVH